MITKAVARRKMHGLAGTRPSLPGLPRNYEFNMRTDLANRFEPRDFLEMIWVVDIAYCSASIEVIRIQIIAVKRLQLRGGLEDIHQVEDLRKSMKVSADLADFTEGELRMLDMLADRAFEGSWNKSLFGNDVFIALLGRVANAKAIALLRDLQVMLHQEMKERDRLFKQIHRTRQQAMHDAIALADAERRAKAVGPVAEPTFKPDDLDLDDTAPMADTVAPVISGLYDEDEPAAELSA